MLGKGQRETHPGADCVRDDVDAKIGHFADGETESQDDGKKKNGKYSVRDRGFEMHKMKKPRRRRENSMGK